MRTGFELGFEDDQGNTYVNNHIMFKILVHPVTAQFLTARDNFYAAEVDVRRRQLLADAAANATGGVLAGDDEVYYTVVGFEALACSIRRNAGWLPAPVSCPESTSTGKVVPPQPVAEGEKIVYTYDVMWEQSEIKWVSRWDSYLRMPRGQVAAPTCPSAHTGPPASASKMLTIRSIMILDLGTPIRPGGSDCSNSVSPRRRPPRCTG